PSKADHSSTEYAKPPAGPLISNQHCGIGLAPKNRPLGSHLVSTLEVRDHLLRKIDPSLAWQKSAAKAIRNFNSTHFWGDADIQEQPNELP
ncbi:MAG: hypothetical protein NTX04_11845, partial [Verrucomicrobia bacterium]|nr:hypothetical protein [Verrucomicrobiota bacterium]